MINDRMNKTRWAWILCALVPALAAPVAVQADRQALAEFVARKSAEAQLQQTEIEARAARLGLPLRQELADGTVLLLRGFGTGGRPSTTSPTT